MSLLQNFNAAADVMESLADQLNTPKGHQFSFDRESNYRWVVGHKGRFGTSVSGFINMTKRDVKNPQQIGVEIRIFPLKTQAHLFVTQGPQYNFMSKSLFDQGSKEPFVYAESFDELGEEIVARVNRALARGKLAGQNEPLNPIEVPADNQPRSILDGIAGEDVPEGGGSDEDTEVSQMQM